MRDTPPDTTDITTKTAEWQSGNAGARSDAKQDGDDEWLKIGRSAYDSSGDWLETGTRSGWQRSIAMFQSEHPPNSKYNGAEYRRRSRLFRPKTRSSVRKGEAQAAAAFFATADQVKLQARNDADPAARAAAEFWQPIMEYRLEHTIPWFLNVCGGMQDGQVMGVVISKQWWDYQEIEDGEEPEIYEEGGQSFKVMKKRPDGTMEPVSKPKLRAIKDEPRCDLIAAENFRLHPASDWRDPVRSSPFVIHEEPMFVGDVRARMKSTDPKTGERVWRDLPDDVIAKGKKNIDDTTTATREKPRRDPRQAPMELQDHDVVWVRTVIVRRDARDWHFVTLGESVMLSDPKPLEEVYIHGERPFVMGYIVFETHKTYPQSKVILGEQLQRETNDTTNLRLDKLKNSLHPRAKVKAGKNVPIESLRSGAPGEPIMLQNMEDVMWDQPPGVDAAAYAEQDRINVDMDELLGSFSQSSVMTNRRMNETVGGMNLLSNAAGTIAEYDLRVFTVTWVEPVLRQILKLEQAYETDTTILGLGLQKSQIIPRYNIGALTDDIVNRVINAELMLTVNVGIGATDPQQRITRLMMATTTFQQVATAFIGLYGPQWIETPAAKEWRSEIFGMVGYKDTDRFFEAGIPPGGMQQPGQDPMAMAAAQGAQQQLQQKDEAHKQAMQQKQESAQLDAQLKMFSAKLDAFLQQQKEAQAGEQAAMNGQAQRTKIVMQADDKAHKQVGSAVEKVAKIAEEMQSTREDLKAATAALKEAATEMKRPRKIKIGRDASNRVASAEIH